MLDIILSFRVQDELDELFLSKPNLNSNETHNQVKLKPNLQSRPGKTVSPVTGTGKPALHPQPKPALKPKPSAKQSDHSNQSEATSGASNLDTDDIMKLIQNAEETEDYVDLFSWFIMILHKFSGLFLPKLFLHVLVFTNSAIRLCWTGELNLLLFLSSNIAIILIEIKCTYDFHY